MSEREAQHPSEFVVTSQEKCPAEESHTQQQISSFSPRASSIGELKIRSNLLSRYDAPTIDRPVNSQVSGRKQWEMSGYPTAPSKFGLTTVVRGKSRWSGDQESRTDLLREYELALDQIQTALSQKNFEVKATLRQLQISLEEKDCYIEGTCRSDAELTDGYEHQIETLESAYYKATQKLLELQNSNKEQAIAMKELAMKLESESAKNSRLSKEVEELRNQARFRQCKISESAKQLCHLIETEKQRNVELSLQNNSLKAQCRELADTKEELGRVTAKIGALELEHQALTAANKQNQELCEKLKAELEVSADCRVTFKQSERLLNERHIIQNLMMKDLNDTKQQLDRLSREHAVSQKSLSKLTEEMSVMQFENQTLRNYNQSLLQKLSEPTRGQKVIKGSAYRQSIAS